ncbi:MAG TPA: metallophosphoesterase [Vicinamibacterales bacterium]|nr:metallophosphoesterase [Vicinamibacterales bacterium]
MALHDETMRKAAVRHVIEEAVAELHRDDDVVRAAACDALGIGTPEWSACRDALIEELDEAEEWIEREEAIVESNVPQPPTDSDTGPEFLPSHPTLALVQSAMEEELERTSSRQFWTRDPKWLSVLYQRLRARARGKAPFISHDGPEDFRFDLPERTTVALVSDWGTANTHAVAVAKQIARLAPEHVIHLGDVYYAGTPREVQRNFLDVWKAHGPRQARYWGLNANHDMYSGGYGYFERQLRAFGQPASYFNLQNRHWRLLGLDSAYINHRLTPEQLDWLPHQVGGSARNILLTHHHVLSPFRKRGDALEESLDPFLAAGQVFAWIWGHEHHLFEFADYRGVKCRCIGHGSLPYVPPDRRRQRHPADIVRMETRPSPLNAARGIHGFALLRFEGPVLDIAYVDEEGGTAWTERWD